MYLYNLKKFVSIEHFYTSAPKEENGLRSRMKDAQKRKGKKNAEIMQWHIVGEKNNFCDILLLK